ncbi:MAG: PLP-dependent transferase, partial [Hyphomicrobiales bacterium]|nr:PLP-dependent transferase [Hyphomicrobiales bacterium]
PQLKIVDLEAVAAITRKANALSVCDNTFSSPYCQRPLEHGIDIAVHSATKFLNGHSDLLAGVAAVSRSAPDGIAERLGYLQNATGAVLSPPDCALLLRSLKTLAIRMDRHCENAMAIARHLDANKERLGVQSVRYPGLPDHPGHAIAARQMSGFGAVITLVLAGGLERADKVLRATRLFQFAVSLGGVESLIQHPASLTHAAVPRERREEIGLVDGLVRLSVGIENADDLIADLEAALS